MFSGLIHPDERAQVDEMYRLAYVSPEASPFNTEFCIRRANNGAERWIAVSGKVTFDTPGQALRGIWTLRDVHERRQPEERYARARNGSEWRWPQAEWERGGQVSRPASSNGTLLNTSCSG